MIVCKHFVYIHTSRTGGTFLNKLILEHVPGARMIQYHGHLEDLPVAFSHLPVIGFVRNPWDWYVSMYTDYRRKQQYVFGILSERGTLGFEETVSRFLTLGDNSIQSKRLLGKLVEIAPNVIDSKTHPRRRNPGLRSQNFTYFPENEGYYSWLFKLMYQSKNDHNIHIGRFENIRAEALRLFQLTGTPITEDISVYLDNAEALNSSARPDNFIGAYPADLELLVAEKENYIIQRFGYEFSEDQWNQYPKADFFRHLGSADVDALIERVKSIPESKWQSENEQKPNNFNNLNDTSHIIFRFIEDSSVFDFHDRPLWVEWKDVLLPVMEQAARSLGYSDYCFPRVMLAKLPAGSEILPHTDGMASHYIHKIHVSLITNLATTFHVGSKTENLPVGEIYEVNNKRSHSVKNSGIQDRIHLIFECYSMDDYGRPS